MKKWMKERAEELIELDGDFCATQLVEQWDVEEGDGTQTLNPLHPAWDVAIDVSEEVELERAADADEQAWHRALLG